MYGSISAPQDDDAATETDGASKGSSIASGVINLVNTVVGAGMLGESHPKPVPRFVCHGVVSRSPSPSSSRPSVAGLPGAFAGTGWLSGSILIALSATLSAHGLVLLSKAARITGKPCSFYSVARASLPRCTVLIDLAVALKCFGVATGYLITMSDSMVDALDHVLLTGRPAGDDEGFWVSLVVSRQFWIAGSLALVVPFSFYRTLDELKKASAVSLTFIFMLVVMIVAYANGIGDPCPGNEDEGACGGAMVPYTDVPSTLSKVPIFVFAFTCQQNIFPIVNEISDLSQRRLNVVIGCSIGIALTLFAAVALEGYSTFGSSVRGDILLNYPENGAVTFLRVCIAIMLAVSYPLQLDPSRRCVTSLVKVLMKWGHQTIRAEGERGASMDLGGTKVRDEEAFTEEWTRRSSSSAAAMQQKATAGDDRLFYVITVTFLSCSFMLAMVVDDLGVILALVGATGSTLVSYVLPGLIYVKVHPVMDLSKAMAYLQLWLGCAIIPLALYFVVTKQINH